MNSYQELQAKYEDKGLDDLKLRSIEDIKDIYNVDVLKLSGYEKLSPELKEFFKEMIVNYYNARGLEARDDMKPKKVAVKDGRLAFYYNNTFNYFNSDRTWG